MLSKQAFYAFDFIFFVCSKLHIIPYDWDETNFQIKNKSTAGKTRFLLLLIFCTILRCSHVYSIGRNIFLKTSDSTVIFSYCIGYIAICVTSMVHMSFFFFQSETAYFINRFLYFLKRKHNISIV